MPTSPPNSCRILTYGKDHTLLMTRKAVLEAAGFRCDTAHTVEGFLECIQASQRGYDIFVLCHSVPDIERGAIVEAARGSHVEVCVLTGLVQPHEFIDQIRELSRSC
jgi:DNA-binding response OmpR family regulator